VHPAWLIGGENVPINMRLSLPAPPSDIKKHVRYHEDFFHIQALIRTDQPLLFGASQSAEEQTAPHAVAALAADLARAIQASAIVAFTSSGTTASRIARKRPNVPICDHTESQRRSTHEPALGRTERSLSGSMHGNRNKPASFPPSAAFGALPCLGDLTVARLR
jgi:hypothetical protein